MGRNSVLWAVIGCALLLHGIFLAQRWALERTNDTVELALDYEAVRLVAEQSGVPLPKLLQRWSALGVTSVAVGGFIEETSDDGPSDGAADEPVDEGLGASSVGQSEVEARLPDALDVAARDRRLVAEAAGFVDRVAPRSLAAAEEAGARGLALGAYIPRGEALEGYPDDVAGTARVLQKLELPVGVVEFVDARGRAELIRTLDYDVVFVHSIPPGEFARLSDEGAVRRFYRAAFERQARLLYMHLRLAPEPAVASGTAAKSGLAAQSETAGVNFRPGVVPPVQTGSAAGAGFGPAGGPAVLTSGSPSGGDVPSVPRPELAERNSSYIRQVVQMLTDAGLRIGPATRAPRWRTPGFVALAAALAAGAAAVLVGGRFVASSARWREGRAKRAVQRLRSRCVVLGLLAGPPFVAALLMAIGRDVLARQGAALAVAVAFPLLAAATGAGIVGVHPFASPGEQLRPGGFGRGLSALAAIFAIGAAGAVLAAGALGDVRFMVKLELFRGVKLAHAVPLAMLIGWWLAGAVFRSGGEQSSGDQRDGEAAATGENSVPLLRTIPWRIAAVALVVLVAGYVLVARTGHTVLPVSAAERAMREWLEATLPVRPRTKEFLLGYPALVFGLWLATRTRGGAAGAHIGGETIFNEASSMQPASSAWAGPFLIAGAVVPISVINTFVHVHISLAVSTMRTVLGLLTGGVVGVVAAGGAAVVFKVLTGRRRSKRRW